MEHGFEISKNNHDWLGYGVYFFEDAPSRAAAWAKKKHKDKPHSVVEAVIELRDCLDLTDLDGVERLTPFYALFVEAVGREFAKALKQTKGNREFDCAVINYACDALDERAEPVRVIREAFQEGEPIWTDPDEEISAARIHALNHVHISVRDVSVIRETNIHIAGEDD